MIPYLTMKVLRGRIVTCFFQHAMSLCNIADDPQRNSRIMGPTFQVSEVFEAFPR